MKEKYIKSRTYTGSRYTNPQIHEYSIIFYYKKDSGTSTFAVIATMWRGEEPCPFWDSNSDSLVV
jgi:hypothetical protein